MSGAVSVSVVVSAGSMNVNAAWSNVAKVDEKAVSITKLNMKTTCVPNRTQSHNCDPFYGIIY